MNTHNKPSAPSQAMLCSTRCLGFILNRGSRRGYEAFDAGERSLGAYTSQRLAADAVSAAARETGGAAP
jgi:hypothetical protein